MIYKGEVQLIFGNKYGSIYTYTHHNGGQKDLQLAFANMLSGYGTTQFIPKYITGAFGVAQITGLNRRSTPTTINGENVYYYVECEAIVPIDGSIANMLDASYQYRLCGQSYDIELATFSPEMDPDDLAHVLSTVGTQVDGIQLNIKWKMYLSLQ